MKTSLKKCLCVFLSILIAVQVFPMSAWAKEITQKQAMENIDTTSVDTNSDEIVIEEEIQSLRTENSKTFLTDNNSYYQVTTTIPMHYYENGEWIDNDESSNISINTVSDVEQYVERQTSALSETQNENSENDTISENSKAITENGNTYINNCQTVIGTYSSTGDDSYTVKYQKEEVE